MKAYDVSCPCCGHKNIDLYLEETEGWMECEQCGELSQVTKRFEKRVRIPVFRMEDVGKAMAASSHFFSLWGRSCWIISFSRTKRAADAASPLPMKSRTT